MATKRKTTRKKKNMKKQQARVPFPVLLANVLVLVAVLGLSYMWLCSRCDALGRDIKVKEQELNVARKGLVSEQDRWSTITSPQNLRDAIRRHQLNMKMPEGQQVVKVGAWNVTGKTAMLAKKPAR